MTVSDPPYDLIRRQLEPRLTARLRERGVDSPKTEAGRINRDLTYADLASSVSLAALNDPTRLDAAADRLIDRHFDS